MNAAVLIPSYQEYLDESGVLSLLAAQKHLSDYDWYTFGPVRRYTRHGAPHLWTPPDLWNAGDDGRRGYSPLMLSRGLYRQLWEKHYSHVLVYQPDAIVFHGDLDLFAAYDYIGAPHQIDLVSGLGTPDAMGVFATQGGNGGLSLRNLDACMRVLDGMPEWLNISSYYTHISMNEDVWWSYQARKQLPSFRVAPLDQAVRFAWETDPALCWLLNKHQLPLGAHGWERHSPEFWENLGGATNLALGLPEPERAAPGPEHQSAA